jgi:hypothetical protein
MGMVNAQNVKGMEKLVGMKHASCAKAPGIVQLVMDGVDLVQLRAELRDESR